MSEYFWQASMQSRGRADEKESMLRGYDPLREIYHWQLILSFSQIGILLVSYFLSPAMNNLSFLDADPWSLPFLGVLILLLVFGSASVLFWGRRRIQRAMKLRTASRLLALSDNNLPCIPIRRAPLRELTLPSRIESHLQKGLTIWISAGVVFVLGDAFLIMPFTTIFGEHGIQ